MLPKKSFHVVVAWIVFSHLIGCASSENKTPVDIVESALQPTIVERSAHPSTATATSTLTATNRPATSTLIPTEPLPTPVLPHYENETYYLSDLIFSESASDCIYPCWHGVIIGKAQQNEVQNLFETVFNFHSEMKLFDQYSPTLPILDQVVPLTFPVQNIQFTGFQWNLEQGYMYSLVLMNSSTNLLEAVQLGWTTYSPSDLKVDMDPSIVLFNLGAPRTMMASTHRIDRQSAQVNILMSYNNGMLFSFNEIIDITSHTANLCLSSNHEEWISAGFALLTVPIQDELTPLQRWAITDTIQTQRMKPFEEIANLSNEKLAEHASREISQCFDIYVP